jgi:1,2-dihydroxy-3,5-cyclohexadiene-1,4-dicarboxylate dehydrogenase
MNPGARLPRIALPIGDPAGIGPEIVLKTLLAGAEGCEPVVVGDAEPLLRHADSCGISLAIEGGRLRVGGRDCAFLDCDALPPGSWSFGRVGAAAGAACRAYALRAIGLAIEDGVDAVLAAPHTEESVNLAGHPFRGYPGLVAEATGTPADRVFLMLLCPDYRVVNTTLHLPLIEAARSLSTGLVGNAIEAAAVALRTLGIGDPRIGVCGLNPHAGENGLFGREDLDVIAPAIKAARARGLRVEGPAPADALFGARAHDVYVAMYHDQGHIPVKVAAPLRSSAVSIGTPIVFGSVAHGSAHDIAGRNRADPAAFATALELLAGQFARDQIVKQEGGGRG